MQKYRIGILQVTLVLFLTVLSGIAVAVAEDQQTRSGSLLGDISGSSVAIAVQSGNNRGGQGWGWGKDSIQKTELASSTMRIKSDATTKHGLGSTKCIGTKCENVKATTSATTGETNQEIDTTDNSEGKEALPKGNSSKAETIISGKNGKPAFTCVGCKIFLQWVWFKRDVCIKDFNKF